MRHWRLPSSWLPSASSWTSWVPTSPALVSSACWKAGTVCNAVAGEAHVAGSLRVFTDGMFDRAREGVRRVLDDACAATGCTYDLDFAEGYPPVDNGPSCSPAFACASELQPCGRRC